MSRVNMVLTLGVFVALVESGALPATAQTADFDLWFIDNMVPHHQGALDMAADALGKASHPELKAFARQVIKDQKAEIAQMEKWRAAWYKGAPSAKSDHIPGMHMMHGAGHGAYRKPASPTYDVEWLADMIAHHEGAIAMSNDAAGKARRTEIKRLASQIIEAQEAEIAQMKKWKAQWEKR